MKNILLVGFGKMGSSLARGWVKDNSKTKYNISVIEKKVIPQIDKTFNNVNFYKNFDEFFLKKQKIDFVVLAVKPQQLNEIKDGLLKVENKNTIFISILAGKSTKWFKENISNNLKIVRAMPNLPASISKGITAIFCSKNISLSEKLIIKKIMLSVGTVSFVRKENQIDVITGISGSGPAYFFYLVEILIEIGIDLGLSKKESVNFAQNTFIGSAYLLDEENKLSAKSLRENVTSPGGTTEAALKVLMNSKNGVKVLFKKAILNAIDRANQLKQ